MDLPKDRHKRILWLILRLGKSPRAQPNGEVQVGPNPDLTREIYATDHPMAAAFKDKGNEAFKAGDYASAIGFYTSAILADSKDPTYPLNRAAAYLKLNKFQDAERDCSKALSIDPKNIKALFRRGQANAGLGSYALAKKDLEQVLAKEPNNQVAKQELVKVEEHLRNEKKPTKRVPKDVQPAPPPRRRVPIKIVDEEITADTEALNASKIASKSRPLIEEISSTTIEVPTTNIPPVKSFQQSKEERLTKTVRNIGGGIFKRDGSHPDSIFESRPITKSASDATTVSAQSSGSTSVKIRDPPSKLTNSFEFQRRWRSSVDNSEKWYLLQMVPPETLATLFKASLEPDLLASIIGVLRAVASQSAENKPVIQRYVEGFTRIPRFDSVTLFLSSAEKEEARSLFQTIDHPIIWAI